MAKNVYPVSIDVNLLKPIKEFYTLNTDNLIASNVFIGSYRTIDCDEEKTNSKTTTAATDQINNNNKKQQQQQRSNSVSNDLTVAIKCFKLENLDKTDFELAMHEAKVLRNLKHKNVLPLLANFVNNDQLWFIMPLAEYGSCYQLCRPFGLSELSIALILKDVLQGLDYIHNQGIIHRGIRSSRVLIDSNGRCVLTGFRHSTSCIHNGKWLNVVHDYPATAKDNINWYAPELLEQNLCGYNFKSDIYSIGILICELANGSVPFEPLSPTELLLDKLTGYIPRLLDKTCEELKTLQIDKMDQNNRTRFQIYKSRRFTDHFHQMLMECCLVSDTNRRYSARGLLGHRFMKQIKKSCNLLSLLPNKISLLDKSINQTNNDAEDELTSKISLCNSRCLSCEYCKHSGYVDHSFYTSSTTSSDGDKCTPMKWTF